MARDEMPVRMVATVVYESYDPDGSLTGFPIAERIKQCIETHPTLSFKVETVVVRQVDAPPDAVKAAWLATEGKRFEAMLEGMAKKPGRGGDTARETLAAFRQWADDGG